MPEHGEPSALADPVAPRLNAAGQRVLVAGATGTLGKLVVSELLARGYNVRALVRDPLASRALALGAVELAGGNLLDAGSLGGLCDNVDTIISCAGASMRMGALRDRRSFMEVDFGGNANLLEIARTSGVAKFVYVSLYGASSHLRTEYAAAHERFVGALAGSEIPYTVVRPTGFFSFFVEQLKMAARGRAILIGDGSAHTNPIDERDLSAICVDAVLVTDRDLPAGGPEVLSRRRIAEMAFEALNKKPRISSISPRAFVTMAQPLSLINKRLHALCMFGASVSTIECVAPRQGHRSLGEYFAERAASASSGKTNAPISALA
jgi:uncharacterized protein YbjT (DUF2867 family)